MTKFKLINPEKIWNNPDEMYQILDNHGKVINHQYKTTLTAKQLLNAYEYMVLSRQQDMYMLQLQKQGRMLTFVPNLGEEALQVAATMAMSPEDWLVPSFRANAAMLYRGVEVRSQLLYWNGNERGSVIDSDLNVLPFNIVIGTQYSHAAGIGYALKLQNKKAAAVTFIGDGGTSEGEFYEAMNIASVHKWPVVFAINNNQFAISTRTNLESGSKTLAAKAVAAGIPAIRVDGNDLLASYEAFADALEWAKNGNGPVLVECFSWRQGQHTTSDDPSIYRTKEEEKENEKREPMGRIRNYLVHKGILTMAQDEKLWNDKAVFVKNAYEESLKEIKVDLAEVFDYTYETLPPELEEQKAEAVKFFPKGGK